MKKVFEFLLILIIFYGVYSMFKQAAPVVFDNPQPFIVVIASLVVAALLLVIYARVIAVSAERKVKAQLSQTITDLEGKIKEKENEVEQKESELKNAFKVKKAVEEEAESTIVE